MAMSNQPWFIDAMDKLEEEFYDQFENELSEYMFVFMTEAMGRMKRSPHEAAEQINIAILGRDMNKMCDDEYEDMSYDEFFMQNADLAGQLMTRLIRRYAESY